MYGKMEERNKSNMKRDKHSHFHVHRVQSSTRLYLESITAYFFIIDTNETTSIDRLLEEYSATSPSFSGLWVEYPQTQP